MRSHFLTLALLAIVTPSTAGYAQSQSPPQSFHVGDVLPVWGKIHPGSHHYLRYRVKDDRRIALDIWSRTISFAPDPKGVERLHIVQKWTGASLPFDREVDSWFEAKTFRPLSQTSKRIAAGRRLFERSRSNLIAWSGTITSPKIHWPS